jgi:hypothetical protein
LMATRRIRWIVPCPNNRDFHLKWASVKGERAGLRFRIVLCFGLSCLVLGWLAGLPVGDMRGPESVV